MFLSRGIIHLTLFTCAYGLPVEHGLIVVAGIFSVSLVLVLFLLYVSRPKAQATADKGTLGPSHCKTLGIFDSLIIFSQFGPNNLELTDDDCQAKMYSSPKFTSEIDRQLLLNLRSTSQEIQ
ncbi:hypothetical protein MJO29_006630 [Puccinia striiformis f. sp. tritici]|uniref:Uncharacterized protein n=1 Tax=Puccinia striiformis TaxID=27350 RepID=A0A2S4W5V4_9BASI|nr:hypothetical protein MJO29_006630 [Puccinia striiformis f. sp. tritici]KAI9629400.1 hypothetical protein KEM48_012997 [Puccinia striiformis f. sp. tritici PST-130]POW17148.1 hypothetical protein PSHT_06509 [Puccinia striiformis]